MKLSRTQIAYRCPECGYATVGFLGGLTAVSDMLRLKCACGGSNLDISKSREGKIHLGVPCVFCKSTHGFTLSTDILSRDEPTRLPCPFSSMNIAFIGDEEKLPDELDRSAEELSAIITSFEAESLKDIQPEDIDGDDVPPDPAIYDSFNFLIKELEADGKISCPCGNPDCDLRFTDEGIQAYCKKCGATHDFYAKSAASAEEYLSLNELTLT